jgi:hypothetical protein
LTADFTTVAVQAGQRRVRPQEIAPLPRLFATFARVAESRGLLSEGG